ncbi:bifunctional riboflavin kinase/FAD synthetase [Cohnella sp. CFH 77786]|uniref:bifunctional riboflavin kinase/FAD synthetase n=1 Tax=Cohnella sp. CFH 77786 TaxID=2662265 RepID=UPI001C609C25|nr:bifunctional riboflavin kinase/FAD synthetase [Cohnella sp. CFH 77786]MBW5444526.1 bifunctional riboflavin kinase/FAD synthetase [Cohnella sp. CFH 77786]
MAVERYELTAEAVGDGSSLPAGARKAGGLSIAIGFFDGVHLGHAEVIRRAVAQGRERGQTPAVMTFDPHPRAVLGQGDQYRTVLTPLEDKLKLLESLGAEAAYVIRFDRAFAEITAEKFVRELLLPLDVRTAVVGFDFSFGHMGEGNSDTLRRCGEGAIEVAVAEPVEGGGDKVSSTRIREELAEGRCDIAARLLGRPYSLRGTVVHGQARGRLLGFPTANVLPEQPYVIPRVGVYAVTAGVVGGRGEVEETHDAVLNVGYRPTFEAPMGELKLEAHLFGFSGDLYGRPIELTFREYLRDERKFGSVDELVAQIAQDSDRARSILDRLREQ